MNLFNFHPITKEYLSTTVAELDPIDKKPLIPSFATKVNVINTDIDHIAVFNGTAWEELPDNRGAVYDTSTKKEVNHKSIGNLPATLTKLKPADNDLWSGVAWVFDLTSAQEKAVNRLKNDRDIAISEPLISNALGENYRYKTAADDRQNLNDQITLAFGGFATCENVGSGLNQRTAHTHDQLFQVALDMALKIQGDHQHYADKLTELALASNQSEINAAVW